MSFDYLVHEKGARRRRKLPSALLLPAFLEGAPRSLSSFDTDTNCMAGHRPSLLDFSRMPYPQISNDAPAAPDGQNLPPAKAREGSETICNLGCSTKCRRGS